MVGGALAITLPPLIVATVHAVPASAPMAGLDGVVTAGAQATSATTAAMASASDSMRREAPGSRRPVTAMSERLEDHQQQDQPQPAEPDAGKRRTGVAREDRLELGLTDRRRVGRVLRHLSRPHPDGLPESAVIAGREDVHRDHDRDQEDQCRPDPAAPEMAAHDPGPDPTDEEDHDPDVDAHQALAHQIEQGTDPDGVAFPVEAEARPRRHPVGHREDECPCDVQEHDPRIQLHRSPPPVVGTRPHEDTARPCGFDRLRTGRGGSERSAPGWVALEVPALRLLSLDRLEQRLEVADAEPARAVALDDLEEEGGAVLDRPREDLEQIALLVTVGLDTELLERIDRDADVADAVGQCRVVLVRQAEELDTVLPELPDGRHDVLGAQRDVLAAGRSIPVEVFLDLALLLARGGLVDRELDPPVAVGHDLRHQRAVVGVDDLVVVVDELREAEDVAVEVD